jgi:hypothetical protein
LSQPTPTLMTFVTRHDDATGVSWV